MFYIRGNDGQQRKLDKRNAQKILVGGLYFDFKEVESGTLLDKTLFGFFEKCYEINRVISKHGFFLKIFERRNMFRFHIKKRTKKK